MINGKKLIYLAGPYWHEDIKVRSKRFKMYTKLAAKLIMNKDVYVISPITHGHPIAQIKGFDLHHDWLPLGAELLIPCDELWVLDIEGWRDSKGTKFEITQAELASKPIKMVTIRGKVSKFKYEA